MNDPTARDRPRLAPEFRNGSLTAISVLVGFSLSFLARWAGTPGHWQALDLIAVALIVVGSALQIFALGSMLFLSSMVVANYERAVRIFLVGLGIVAVGVALAILGEISASGSRVSSDNARHSLQTLAFVIHARANAWRRSRIQRAVTLFR